MKNIILTKLLISVTSAGLMLTALTSNVQAISRDSLDIHTDKNIQIFYHNDLQSKVYKVDGKRFYWRDLTKLQQQRLLSIEEKIKQIEEKFAIDEAKLTQISQQIEQKAAIIEQEVAKFDHATINVNKQNLSLNDLQAFMHELTENININQSLIDEKTNEIDLLSQQIKQTDMSFITKMKEQTDVLEQVLIDIVKEFD